MVEQPVGPRCGNNPNVQLTPGDRKAVADFKARLALKAAAKPYIDRAVWVDGDPLMEVIAVTVWERCARDDQEMPQAVCDDPRTIAAFAAAVARAHAAVLPEPTDRADELAALVRDFLDPDPCSFDHHGYCQAHAAGFGGEPMSCPHGRARKLLTAMSERPAVARQDGAPS
ncbi:hypothetical protein ABT063_24660 [Streptomyces sp. NPDC002838]|uniref:hypothetical protein n=1 Tax=Streptomyces sp. NPDC002838 TaxID=3154436 RepID=UPI00332A3827